MVEPSMRALRIEMGALAPIPSNNASPLNYIGGKAKVAEKLWRLRPVAASFDTIIDPFFGGGATPLTFARLDGDCKKNYRVRDMFGPTVNFWQVLQAQPWELAKAVDTLFHRFADARALYMACLDHIKEWQATGQGSVMAAAAYYIHTHTCVPATQLHLLPRGYGPLRATKWLNNAKATTGRLIQWSELITGWDIRQQDYKATMDEAAALGGRAFAFIDPPYEGQDAELYDCSFTADDHDRLAELVSAAGGKGAKCMVTINHSPVNDRRYADHFRLLREQVYAVNEAGTNQKKVGTELVILTYEPPCFRNMVANNNWRFGEVV